MLAFVISLLVKLPDIRLPGACCRGTQASRLKIKRIKDPYLTTVIIYLFKYTDNEGTHRMLSSIFKKWVVLDGCPTQINWELLA